MNPDILNIIIVWVFPPVLGAIIGYVTNDIAIKMLFRPLKEVRIFGIRIPFTPGIIPKQRHALAESIGNMVSKDLITAEAIRGHIDSRSFQNDLEINIGRFTDDFLKTPVSGFKTQDLDFAYDSFREILAQTLKRFLGSANFLSSIDEIIRNTIAGFSEKKVKDILSQLNIKKALSGYILPFLSGERIKSWLLKALSSWTEVQLKNNTPLSQIVPEGLINGTVTLLKSILPDLTEAFFKWLNDGPIKKDIERQGRVLLKSVLDKLNFFQRFVVTVAQYESTLNEKMPDIIDEIIQKMKQIAIDTERLDEFVNAIRTGIAHWLSKGAFDFFYNEGIDINEKITMLVEKFFSIIGSENTHTYIIGTIDEILEKNRDMSLGAAAENVLGLDREKITGAVLDHVRKLLTDEKTPDFLSAKILGITGNMLERSKDTPLREAIGLTESSKARIDAFIVKNLVSLFRDKLPEVVESFNIKELVVNKINGLDVESVEKLLLMVIAKHLKWINVFGAILGGLIGFVQVLINLLMP